MGPKKELIQKQKKNNSLYIQVERITVWDIKEDWSFTDTLEEYVRVNKQNV